MQVPEIEKQIGIDIYSTGTDGLGGQLRQEVEDFIVKEITNREEGTEGKYLVLELTKHDWDTHHLTRTLCKNPADKPEADQRCRHKGQTCTHNAENQHF